MIVSLAWSPTAGGVSGPGLEPNCLGAAGINDGPGVGIEIEGGDTVDASVVANTVAGARLTPTTGVMLSGEILESAGLLNDNR